MCWQCLSIIRSDLWQLSIKNQSSYFVDFKKTLSQITTRWSLSDVKHCNAGSVLKFCCCALSFICKIPAGHSCSNRTIAFDKIDNMVLKHLQYFSLHKNKLFLLYKENIVIRTGCNDSLSILFICLKTAQFSFSHGATGKSTVYDKYISICFISNNCEIKHNGCFWMCNCELKSVQIPETHIHI